MRAPRLALAAIASALSFDASAAPQVAWRFRMEAPHAGHRAAVDPEGRVFVQDSNGDLYALAPTGALLWSFVTGGQAEGAVALGADGTIHAAANPAGPDVRLYALHPDGSVRWVFTDTNTQGILAGPTVGPDGKIYLSTEAIPGFGGLGAVALHPEGGIAWTNPGSPSIIADDGLGAEIVFGPGSPGAPLDQLYIAVDGRQRLFAFSLSGQQRFATTIGNNSAAFQFQAGIGPEGNVYLPSIMGGSSGYKLRAYAPGAGSLLWEYPDESISNASEIETAADGAVYVSFMHAIDAVNPDGSRRWRHDEPGVYKGPVPHPSADLLVVGGRIALGQAGFIKGLTRAGLAAWRIDLPSEMGVHLTTDSRTRFSPNGRRAYISVGLPGLPGGPTYCYLYAIDLDPIAGDLDADGAVNFGDLNNVLSHFGAVSLPGSQPGDANGDGRVNFADLNIVLSNFGAGA